MVCREGELSFSLSEMFKFKDLVNLKAVLWVLGTGKTAFLGSIAVEGICSSMYEWVVREGQNWGSKWSVLQGPSRRLIFVSRSLSTSGRNEAFMRSVMFLYESAIESGKTFGIRAPCLPLISPASWTQSYRSSNLCLVWNFGQNPVLLPVSPL